MESDSKFLERHKKVVDASARIIMIIDEFHDTNEISAVYAACISNLLCSQMASEDDAHEMFMMITDKVNEAVLFIKNRQTTSWAEGTPH